MLEKETLEKDISNTFIQAPYTHIQTQCDGFDGGKAFLNIFPETRTNGWERYENFIECKFARPIFFPVINLF